jgi:hypothetical protein
MFLTAQPKLTSASVELLSAELCGWPRTLLASYRTCRSGMRVELPALRSGLGAGRAAAPAQAAAREAASTKQRRTRTLTRFAL